METAPSWNNMWLDDWWKWRRDKCMFTEKLFDYFWPQETPVKKEGNNGDYILELCVNWIKQQMIYNHSKIIFFTKKCIAF